MTASVTHARRISRIVALWIPLALTMVAVALMIVWLPDLPETIAIHWNAAGHADGFAPAWSMPVIAGATGTLLALVLGLLPVLGSREGEWGPTLRLLGAVSLGMSVFLLTAMTWSVAMQRGLADAHDAPSIVPALAVGAAVGAIAGVVGWFVQPTLSASGGHAPSGTAPEAMTLAAGERVVWLRTTTLPRGFAVTIVVAILVLAVAALATSVTGGEASWALGVLAAVFVVLLATTGVFRVRVSDAGLRVSAPVGIPRFVIPLDDIESVSVVDVQPLAQFGGYGIRLGLDGRFGVVLHGGEGIQVSRRAGKTFVVAVDDAATGAALLQALARRASA